MVDVHKNFAYSTVATAPSPATTGTSLVVAAGTGSRFPTPPFNATIWPSNTYPTTANAEIVRVTAISTDTLTITRNVNLLTEDPDYMNATRTVLVGDQIAATVTNKVLSDIERPLDITSKIGSLTIIGQSYTAGATQADVGTPNARQESLVSKLMSLLDITETNVLHLGQAGSKLTGAPQNAGEQVFGGWPGVAQFVLPNNSSIINAASDVVITDPIVSVGGAYLLVHGANDMFAPWGTATAPNEMKVTNALRAGDHAYRFILSRIRAGVVYAMQTINGVLTPDSTTSTSGSWINVSSVVLNSGSGIRATADFTGSAVFTITIPQNFTGGTIGVCFLGAPNGVTTVPDTSLNNTTSPVTFNVVSKSELPTSGTVVLRCENEDMLVTAHPNSTSYTVTRGVNGTSAAAHAANSVISVSTNNYKVTVGGTAGFTGTMFLSGQGHTGFQAPVTKRFSATADNAGQTITFTPGGLVTGDTSALAIFDSWWIESAQPNPTVVTNIHDYQYGYVASTNNPVDYITDWNDMLEAVVDEFDGYVQIADVYTKWWERNGTISGGISDSASSITFVSNSANFTPVKNMYFTFGKNGGETVRITSVAGAHPSWTLGIARGQDSTVAVSHSAGDWVGPRDWMYKDNFHLSIKGHSVYADVIYRAFNNMPAPMEYQMAQTQGNWSQHNQLWHPGVIDNFYMYTTATAVSSTTMTVGRQNAVPIYVPKHAIITEIGVNAAGSVPGAGGTIRFGVYLPDYTNSRPGRLLQEFGTVKVNAAGTAAVIGCYQVIRPGWYWLSMVNQGLAATITTTSINAGPFPNLMAQTPSLTTTIQGMSKTGITGALADWGTVYTYETSNMPRMYVRLRSPMLQ